MDATARPPSWQEVRRVEYRAAERRSRLRVEGMPTSHPLRPSENDAAVMDVLSAHHRLSWKRWGFQPGAILVQEPHNRKPRLMGDSLRRWAVGENREVIAEREIPMVSGMEPALVVLLLSVGSGAVAFLGLGLLAWASGWAVRVALGGAGFVMLVVWGVWMVRVPSLMVARESVVMESLAPPAPRDVAPQVVSVEIAEPERGRLSFLDVPMEPTELIDFARGLCAGRPLSESEWSGGGRLLSRAQFRSLRAALMDRGFAVWRDADAPQLGVQLTPSGRALVRELARARACVSGGSAIVRQARDG